MHRVPLQKALRLFSSSAFSETLGTASAADALSDAILTCLTEKLVTREMGLANKKQFSNFTRNTHYICERANITDREQFEGLLEQILQSTPDPMIMVDQHGKIIFANLQEEIENFN